MFRKKIHTVRIDGYSFPDDVYNTAISIILQSVVKTRLTWVCWSGRGRPGPADFLWQQHLHRVVVRRGREATDLCGDLRQSGSIHPQASPPSPHVEPLRAESSAELPADRNGKRKTLDT